MMNKYYEFIRLSDARKPWVFIKVSIMILKSSRVQLHSPQGPAEKKTNLGVAKHEFLRSQNGGQNMVPDLGPLKQNIKGRGQKQGRKMAPFSASKTGSNVCFSDLFSKKWLIFAPIFKQNLAPLLLKTDILQYAELIRLLMLMTKILMNL